MLVAAAALLAVAHPSAPGTVWLAATARWLPAPGGSVWVSVPNAATPALEIGAGRASSAGAPLHVPSVSIPAVAATTPLSLAAVKALAMDVPAVAPAALVKAAVLERVAVPAHDRAQGASTPGDQARQTAESSAKTAKPAAVAALGDTIPAPAPSQAEDVREGDPAAAASLAASRLPVIEIESHEAPAVALLAQRHPVAAARSDSAGHADRRQGSH